MQFDASPQKEHIQSDPFKVKNVYLHRKTPQRKSMQHVLHVIITCLSSTVALLPIFKATLMGTNTGCSFRT